MPNAMVTASKEPSLKGSVSAWQRARDILSESPRDAIFFLARRSISELGSTPKTRASGRTSTVSRATSPVPVAMSSTVFEPLTALARRRRQSLSMPMLKNVFRES